jgi:hypothetical protein
MTEARAQKPEAWERRWEGEIKPGQRTDDREQRTEVRGKWKYR